TWGAPARLTAWKSAASGDIFGFRVALSGDTLAVAAPWDDNVEPDSGAVYVFRRDETGEWRPEEFLKPLLPGKSDMFGASIALAGNVLIVSAPFELGSDTGLDGDPAN